MRDRENHCSDNFSRSTPLHVGPGCQFVTLLTHEPEKERDHAHTCANRGRERKGGWKKTSVIHTHTATTKSQCRHTPRND